MGTPGYDFALRKSLWLLCGIGQGVVFKQGDQGVRLCLRVREEDSLDQVVAVGLEKGRGTCRSSGPHWAMDWLWEPLRREESRFLV